MASAQEMSHIMCRGYIWARGLIREVASSKAHYLSLFMYVHK